MRTAVVLGGGGLTGIAWEIGILKGLAEEGIDLSTADEMLGTSAGSVVSVLARSRPIDDLYDGQLEPPDMELGGTFSGPALLKAAPLVAMPGTPIARRRRIAQAALAEWPDGGNERVRIIGERLEVDDWPEGLVRITAINAITGELEIFDSSDGVDVVQAVAASCAVPFVWPAVVIDGIPYLDGGLRSPTNADLVGEADVVVVLAPLPVPFSRHHTIAAQLARAGAARSIVITPDREAKQAMGRNVLNPARQQPAARTGLRQGREVAAKVRAVWPSRVS